MLFVCFSIKLERKKQPEQCPSLVELYQVLNPCFYLGHFQMLAGMGIVRSQNYGVRCQLDVECLQSLEDTWSC